MRNYDPQTGLYRFKACIRLPTGTDTVVFVWARNQGTAKELVKAQYSGAHIISGYVGLA
jgi:hypothetical protein